MTEYPKPCSAEALAQGCTCDPKEQSNPNWSIINPKCPVHGGTDYLLWYAQQSRSRKRKV